MVPWSFRERSDMRHYTDDIPADSGLLENAECSRFQMLLLN